MEIFANQSDGHFFFSVQSSDSSPSLVLCVIVRTSFRYGDTQGEKKKNAQSGTITGASRRLRPMAFSRKQGSSGGENTESNAS